MLGKIKFQVLRQTLTSGRFNGWKCDYNQNHIIVFTNS